MRTAGTLLWIPSSGLPLFLEVFIRFFSAKNGLFDLSQFEHAGLQIEYYLLDEGKLPLKDSLLAFQNH